MVKRKRNRLAVLLAGFCLFAALSGCGPKQIQTPEETASYDGESAVQASEPSGQEQALLGADASWKYLDQYTEPPGEAEWTALGLDESAWKTGTGSFGSKDGRLEAVGDAGAPDVLLNQYDGGGESLPVYFFRTHFRLERPELAGALEGRITYDDAAVIYINGRKVYEGNVPEEGYPTLMSYGSEEVCGSPREETFRIQDTSMLVSGDNVIAVEIHQDSPQSSDIYFAMTELKTALPEYPQMCLMPGEDESRMNLRLITDQKQELTLCFQSRGGSGVPVRTQFQEEYLEEAGRYAYTAELSGLIPGRAYEYWFENGPVRSRTYECHAADYNSGFTFWFLGDPQLRKVSLNKDYQRFVSALEAGNAAWGKPAFILTAGDIADSGEDAESYLRYMETALFKELPVYSAKGNHDASLYDELLSHPQANESGDYAFTRGEALFVVFDSNEENFEEKKALLEEAVRVYDKKWVIVSMHHSIFSAGKHSDSGDIREYRRIYSEMFSGADVDLVLMGHDHTYTRTWLMEGETPVLSGEPESVFTKEKSQVLYITANSSSGSKFYEIAGRPDYAAAALQTNTASLTKVEVNSGEITVTTCSAQDMAVIDQVTLQK